MKRTRSHVSENPRPAERRVDHAVAREAFAGSAHLCVNKRMLTVLGPEKAALLANLIDKERYFEEHGMLKAGRWFFLMHAQQLTQTGIQSEWVLVRIKRGLKELRVISTKMIGLPAKEHYRIDYDALIMMLRLNDQMSPEVPDLPKREVLDLPEVPDLLDSMLPGSAQNGEAKIQPPHFVGGLGSAQNGEAFKENKDKENKDLSKKKEKVEKEKRKFSPELEVSESLIVLLPAAWRLDHQLHIALRDYVRCRLERKAGHFTPTVIKCLARKLGKYSLATSVEALRESAERGWIGVFPEHGNGSSSGKPAQGSRQLKADDNPRFTAGRDMNDLCPSWDRPNKDWRTIGKKML